MGDTGLTGLLDDDAELERLGGGFDFIEGPVWHGTGGFLLFSDMPGDVRRRWEPEVGVTEVLRPSRKGNGMIYDSRGALVVCEHSTSSLVRQDGDRREVLASHYEGRELNSPNDVVVATDGTLYFTDPSYGRMEGFGVPREQELDFQGVYRLDPDGDLSLLADDFVQPNGLCFSPDESLLYVNDTERHQIRVFERGAGGRYRDAGTFADGIGPDPDLPGAPDGMKCDEHGNVYVTGPGGVWVFSPAGQRLGAIAVPEPVGNLNWGGSHWHDLFIAASTSLYCIRMAVRGNTVPGMAV